MHNSDTIGFLWHKIAEDDALSPFTGGLDHTICQLEKFPQALRPTKLQFEIVHHPWIDLLPFPEMRDNILRAGNEFEDVEDQLCCDLIGYHNRATERTGMIIWGNPWDISQWEVSDGFLKQWGWTIRGSSSIIEATNQWREKRGEEPLDFGILG
jgi:hypothetical protein